MQPTIRPFVTVGVAMAAAGAVAFTPLAVPPPDVQVAAPAPVSASVELTASWEEVFNTAAANATKLAEFYSIAPGAALQQSIVNQVGYLQDAFNDPAAIGAVFETMAADAQRAFNLATLQGLSDMDLINAAFQSNDLYHAIVVSVLPSFLPEGTPEFVGPLVHFLASPLSGVLIASVGPLISPAVAALNSIQEGDLLNLPANVVDGFLNGATLDLGGLLPAINGAGFLPEGTTFDKLGIAFGGLLSPGETASTPDGGYPPAGGVGGSIFSSIDLQITSNATGRPIVLPAPGKPLGPIAAWTNLSQMVAVALGWDGTGNPLEDLTEPAPAPASGTTSTLAAAAHDGPAALPSAPRQLASLKVSSDAAPEVKSLSPSETPAVDSADTADEAKAVEVSAESGTENSAEGATSQVVRESQKAEPGKTGTTRVKPAVKLRESIDSVGDKVNSTVKKVRDGLKSGFSKPAKKSVAGAKKSAGSDGAGAAGSGGDSDK